MKKIDLIYRATGEKGAIDGGGIRKAFKAYCESVSYSPFTGDSAEIVGIDEEGKNFIKNCPVDCIVEIIGGDPAIYQAEVKKYS